MRVHQLLALSGLMLMSNVAAGAKLEHDDVPNRCWNVCGPVVGIANKCDGMHHDNDSAEIKCICDWNQAPSLVPLCEACIAEYRSSNNNNNNNNTTTHDNDHDDHDDDNDRHDPHDNDAYDILTSCRLSTTSYNPSAATSALSSTGTSPSTADATATSTGTGTGSGSGSGSSSGSSTTSSGSNAQTTGNAAPAASVPKAATMAAVMGLGFLAWL